MVVAVASGKGGTGKTTVAVGLALAASKDPLKQVHLLDCDVEEPNAGLFLDVEWKSEEVTGVPVPDVDMDRCTFCGACSEACVWNAIAVAGEKVLVFKDLCHGCGSCSLVCPHGAIREELHGTGLLQSGNSGGIQFARGILNVGQAMPVPVISTLLKKFLPQDSEATVILDSSPGTSCPVVEVLGASEYAVLVTEPTPFGLHDLRATVDIIRNDMDIPAGVIINRDGIGTDCVNEFCRQLELPILARIPMDMRIASFLSRGIPLSKGLPEYDALFSDVLSSIETELGK